MDVSSIGSGYFGIENDPGRAFGGLSGRCYGHNFSPPMEPFPAFRVFLVSEAQCLP